MKYNEILKYIKKGYTVINSEREYKSFGGVLYWRNVGEKEWISFISDKEKEQEWQLVK